MLRMPHRFLAALVQCLVLVAMLAPGPAAAAPGWEPIGPDGADGDRVFSTGDPRIFYATTQNAGLYRSDDQGDSWRHLTFLNFSAFAVDPLDPNRIVACVGCQAAAQFDVMRSADGGRTFRPAGAGLRLGDQVATTIFRFFPDRSNPGVDYAATDIGLFRSVAGGRWSVFAFPGVGVRLVAIDPRSPSTWYANTITGAGEASEAKGEIVRSRDAGATWESLALGELDPFLADRLVVDPVRDDRVYAAVGCDLYGFDGLAWGRLGGGDILACPLVATPGGALLAQRWSAPGLVRSDDGGLTWRPQPGPPDYAINILSPAANPHLIFLAGGRGLWRSLDGGAHWRPASHGISGFRVAQLLVAPDAAGTVFASPGGEGVFRSRDQGRTWKRTSVGLNGDRRGNPVLAIDPRDPDALWAGGSELHRSTDGGDHWVGVTLPGRFPERILQTILIDPWRPGSLYVRTAAHTGADSWESFTYRSRDDGRTWEPLPRLYRDLDSLAIAASDGTLYGATAAGFWVSRDGGSTWRHVVSRSSRPSPPFPSDMAIDPTRPDVLWVVAYETPGAWRSEDGGRTFSLLQTSSDGFAPVPDRIFLDAGDPSHPLVAGEGGGVRRWMGLPAGWVEVGPARGEVDYAANGPLAVDSARGLLYAGTNGFGIFRLRFGSR